jgi:hypothetical protein
MDKNHTRAPSVKPQVVVGQLGALCGGERKVLLLLGALAHLADGSVDEQVVVQECDGFARGPRRVEVDEGKVKIVLLGL